MGKLKLPSALNARAHALALAIARDIDADLSRLSTVSIERAVVRLLGMSGAADGRPVANIFVDQLAERGLLVDGAAPWIGRAMLLYGENANHIGRRIAEDRLNWDALLAVPSDQAKGIAASATHAALSHAAAISTTRKLKREEGAIPSRTKLYCLTATGNVHEDIRHARVAANAGADIIAIIRSTAQSLYDFVPEGATTEGFGGTFATQENFRLLREAMDAWSAASGRYVELSSFCSGLCMSEIAVIGVLEGFDNMVNDALYGILYRDINPYRTLTDQRLSRLINGNFGVRINTGEDNYLRTEDPIGHSPNVLASQLINFHMARECGVSVENISVGNAFEIDPDLRGGLLNEIAYAQLTREMFPSSPVKYMPPTRHMNGNVFRTHACDMMFNVVTALTGQGIQTTGALTEGLWTPHIHDRSISVDAALYVREFADGLCEEIEFRDGGKVQRFAQQTLSAAVELLEQISHSGLLSAIEDGVFGG